MNATEEKAQLINGLGKMPSTVRDSFGRIIEGTDSKSGTPLTQPRSGFDPVDTRRSLIAKRVAAGSDTPIGHRCSNLVELLDNYANVESDEQRSHLEANIRRQMADLAGG